MPPESAPVEPERPIRLTALVHGFVQGVGYRDYCTRTAYSLGKGSPTPITGYARNLPTGTTVEVVAEGPRALLDDLLTQLRDAPGIARVMNVEASWRSATNEFDGFAQRY